MTGITYGLIEEKYNCDGKSRISYGVAVYSDSATDGSTIIVESVHDITCDKEKLLKLINNCNDLQLSRIHLSDVIEDFLT